MKSTFAEELDNTAPFACYDAVLWVKSQERQGLDDNEIWQSCERGDWLHWLLLDAFNIGEGGTRGFSGEWYHDAVASLRAVLDYPMESDPVTQRAFAYRIRKIFPEWPL